MRWWYALSIDHRQLEKGLAFSSCLWINLSYFSDAVLISDHWFVNLRRIWGFKINCKSKIERFLSLMLRVAMMSNWQIINTFAIFNQYCSFLSLYCTYTHCMVYTVQYCSFLFGRSPVWWNTESQWQITNCTYSTVPWVERFLVLYYCKQYYSMTVGHLAQTRHMQALLYCDGEIIGWDIDIRTRLLGNQYNYI